MVRGRQEPGTLARCHLRFPRRSASGRSHGFAAKGVLYGIIGIIAIAVALGQTKSTADQQGALASLAENTPGKLLLAVLALGLAAYALFRLYEVVYGPIGQSDDAEGRLERIASAVRFLIYAGLTVLAVRILVGAGGGSSNTKSSASTVFDLPAGTLLVIGAGVALCGVALYQLYEGLSNGFLDDLRLAEMDDHEKKIAKTVGTAGHCARAVVFALSGGFSDQGRDRARRQGGNRPRRRPPRDRSAGLRSGAAVRGRARTVRVRLLLPDRVALPARLSTARYRRVGAWIRNEVRRYLAG